MKLTLKDLQRFLTEDTFYHFVARKHGCFIKNEDDLSEVRCKAILGVMRRYNEEYEFEDEKHLYSSVELTVWNAIRTMLKSHSLNKNNLPIDSECTLLRGDGEETWSIYELNAIADTKEYDNTIEWLMSSAQNSLDPIQMHVFERTLQGLTATEIAEEFQWSTQNVHTRLKTIVKILKKLKDAEEREIQFTVPRVSKDIKRKPSRTYTASHSRRSEASDFLNS